METQTLRRLDFGNTNVALLLRQIQVKTLIENLGEKLNKMIPGNSHNIWHLPTPNPSSAINRTIILVA